LKAVACLKAVAYGSKSTCPARLGRTQCPGYAAPPVPGRVARPWPPHPIRDMAPTSRRRQRPRNLEGGNAQAVPATRLTVLRPLVSTNMEHGQL